jgi:hypothetical protein
MMARMKLFAQCARNQYHVVLLTSALNANSSFTSHAQSYPLRYNTLCIQTTPSFSKRQSQSIHIVMPAVGVATDASSTGAIFAISTLTSNVSRLVGQLNLTTVINMNSFPSFSSSTSLVNYVVRIATIWPPRYVAFVNSWLTLYVL